jgi:hypothetical protein
MIKLKNKGGAIADPLASGAVRGMPEHKNPYMVLCHILVRKIRSAVCGLSISLDFYEIDATENVFLIKA